VITHWKPLLAATLPQDADLSALPYPLYASPKLDGVRCMIQNGAPISRNFKAFRNPAVAKKFGFAAFEGLDGELTIGPPYGSDVYNKTAGCLNSGKAEAYQVAMKLLRFNVFDIRTHLAFDFVTRLETLRRDYKNQGAQIVEQKLICNAAALTAYEEQMLAKGYEGLMLRAADSGAYMEKRSTLREFVLVKMKRVERAFARILEIYSLERNLNTEKTSTGKRSSKKVGIVVDKTRIGSALLKDTKTGVEFSVSVAGDVLQKWTGWKDKSLWAGKLVAYRYQMVGTMNGVPRFPICSFSELIGD
jgi:DNA ligase-1